MMILDGAPIPVSERVGGEGKRSVAGVGLSLSKTNHATIPIDWRFPEKGGVWIQGTPARLRNTEMEFGTCRAQGG